MAKSETTAPSLDVPTSDPSNGGQPETAPSSDAESQSSSSASERGGDRPRTRVVVYALPPELTAEQSGATADPNSEIKAEPKPESAPTTPESERPSYSERARLNAMESLYRGTFLGAFTLNRLYRLSYLQDGEEETPQRKEQIEFFRSQYESIHRDLKKYDEMAGISNVGEAASAFAGQFGASMLSPESWIGPVRAGTLLVRALRGGLTQGGIQLVTDPIVQRLSIKSRVQESFDPVRTVAGVGLGFVGGAAIGALAGSRADRGGGATTSAPNPWGRLGGPEHRAKVKERGDALAAQGYAIFGGGGRYGEKAVKIPGGRPRFPDISARDPLGNLYYENIGLMTKSGVPIARERRNLENLGKTSERYSFTPYDKANR